MRHDPATPTLRLEGIRKSFIGVKALDGVNLTLRAGEVMALIGENGAGKSTAVKIMTGIYRPDGGKIVVEGQEHEFKSTQDSWNAGITAVHQETVMFDELSVAENIFMGHMLTKKGGALDWAEMTRRAADILKRLEADFDARTPLKTLSVAQKHMVEIARALSHDSRVVIMDEPTAALSRHEIEELYGIVRRLKEAGKAILFISHKFDEIFAIADRYTVFRDGTYVAEGLIADATEEELVRMMVGRSVSQLFPKHEVEIGAPILEVNDLSNATEFDGISFTLHKGEVLGFYGLVGAGRTEVMEALFGLKQPTRGTIRLKGQTITAETPKDMVAKGIVYVPEDRQHSGAILPMSIRDNITLPSIRHLSHGIFLNDGGERAMSEEYIGRLSVKCASMDQKVSELSGGNQQKVVIGKWLATEPEIIILDEPTKGIDVGSKSAVHAFVGELVSQGLAVIMVSSELPELMGMSDRIIVMHQGLAVHTIERADFDAETIAAAATGLGAKEAIHA